MSVLTNLIRVTGALALVGLVVICAVLWIDNARDGA